ncbi:MAG: PAS domain S-box protein [Hyphomicrobiaceae bacterium]
MNIDSNVSQTRTVEALILNAILESAVAGILSITSKGTIRTVNPMLCKMFGYDAHELVGRNVSLLMHGNDRRHHDHHIGRYLETGENHIIGIGREVTGRHKDGRLLPLHLSIGEFTAQGETFFTGVLIDLSKQKVAEEQLTHQQARFRAVYECLPDPVIIVDADMRVSTVNPAFTRVFGYAAKDIEGQTSEVIFAKRDDWIEECRRRAGPSPDASATARQTEFRRNSGELFPGSVVSTIIETPGRQRLGHLYVIRDITAEKRQEAQLMQAQRMEAIGQLTGGIAHDFNNILTVVIGNVELLEMQLKDENSLMLVREARDAAEIGARLTDRLLTFGRRQLLETRHINLNEFVLGLTEILRRTIGENIDVSTVLSSDLALTEADPGEVENAVLNLAINARDAMPKGGRLVIETRNMYIKDMSATHPDLEPGHYVVLSVSDTGHGMTAQVQARAFEPFFTTKRSADTGRGTGLGLATIYGFVKQSGGNVTITSAPGAGATVEILLPSVKTADNATSQAAYGAQIPSGGGQRVLVVEDNESVRRLTQRRLVELGYRVDIAANAVEALELLAADSDFDLVFTDVVMPGGLSGIDLAREIKHHFPHVRVMITTGYAEEVLLRSGMDQIPALLRKPYSQSDLARAVAQSLSPQ